MSNRTGEGDAYLQNLEPERRATLEELRTLIFEVVPDAVGTMRHGTPAYDYSGGELCLLPSQKHHMSLYIDPTVVEKHRHELNGLNAGKSCIRFRKLEALPKGTVVRTLKDVAGKG